MGMEKRMKGYCYNCRDGTISINNKILYSDSLLTYKL